MNSNTSKRVSSSSTKDALHRQPGFQVRTGLRAGASASDLGVRTGEAPWYIESYG